jgi:hypothetical protein
VVIWESTAVVAFVGCCWLLLGLVYRYGVMMGDGDTSFKLQATRISAFSLAARLWLGFLACGLVVSVGSGW